MRARRSLRPAGVFVGAALAGLAFVLLTHDLTRPSLWVDELFSLQIASARSPGEVVAGVVAQERRPPLYHLLLHFWLRLSGPPEFAGRLLSVFAAVLAVAATVALARRLAGPRAAGLAGLLLALSPAFGLYGRMIRYYSLLAVLAVLATLSLVRLLRNQLSQGQAKAGGPESSKKRGSFVLFLNYFLSALALLFTDYGAVAVILIHNVFFWIATAHFKRGRGPWSLMQALLLAAWLAWLAVARPWVGGPGLAADLSGSPLGFGLKLGYGVYSFVVGETLFPWNPIAWLALGAAGSALWRGLRQPQAGRRLLAGLTFVPILVSAGLSAALAADLSFATLPSRTLHALPFFALLVAAGLAQPAGSAPGCLRWVPLALLCAANGSGLLNLYAGREYLNPIYNLPAREIAARLAAHAQPGDVIVADWDSAVPYYLRQAGLPNALLETPPPEAALAALRGASPRPPRVWLVRLGRDRTRALEADAPGLATWLSARYPVSLRWNYGEQDPAYRAVKGALLRRDAYRYRATVVLYAGN